MQAVKSVIARPLILHYNHYVLAVSGTVHNSCTTWYILIKFLIYMHVNIPLSLACETIFYGRWFAGRQFCPVAVSENVHNS